MTPGEKRYALLVRLAWELRRLGIGSYVVVPAQGEALLQVGSACGNRLSVLVAQYGVSWVFMWSPGGHVRADDLRLAARTIAAAASRRAA